LGLVFPASPVPKTKLKKGLGILEAFNFSILKCEVSLTEKGYLAGTDDERLEGLMAAFRSPETQGVLAARGGFGCLRLLPRIDWATLPKNKPMIGFSDVTALHMSRLAHTGEGGWHAPVVSSYTYFEPNRREETVMALQGRGPDNWAFAKREVLREGLARGPLMGGNLTLINSLLGTGHLPSFKGAILMIEDVDEQNYRLDRQLTVLWLSGKLKDIAGLVFGEFVNCGFRDNVKKLLAAFARECLPDVPAVRGAPFGHGKINSPWWYGEEAELAAGPGQAGLTFLER
jgi:muramoyltetrapeptide carboxypeptidase